MDYYTLLSGTMLLGISSLSHPALAQKTAKEDRKALNVVFILADDLGYGDLGCYGQEKFDTPNIDALAQHGLRFTQCYSGTTVSAPSRSCLLTGLHSGHTPIRGNREMNPEGQFPFPAGTYTFFHAFQQAGYHTAAFGKWGLGFVGTTGDPRKMGVDEFFGFNCQLLAHSYYPTHLWHNAERVDLPDNAPGKQYGKGTYAPDTIQKEALAYLDKQKAGKPFFLFYPTTIPHAELIVPEDSLIKKYRGHFPETPYEGTQAGNEAFQKGGYCTQLYPRATFAAMVSRLDMYVGQLVAKLKEKGLYDHTLILFASDNGPHCEGGADPDFFNSNGIWRGYKRDLYEGGIRVPLIISWPGHIIEGKENNLMCSFWDLLPTFIDLLNGKENRIHSDGISLLPTLLNHGRQQTHPFLYFEFQELNGRQAVREGKWKLLHLNIRGKKPYYELYNLEADPSERHNVLMEYPDIVERLKGIMQKAHVDDSNWPLFVK